MIKKTLLILAAELVVFKLGSCLWKKSPWCRKIEQEQRECEQKYNEEMDEFMNSYVEYLKRKREEKI